MKTVNMHGLDFETPESVSKLVCTENEMLENPTIDTLYKFLYGIDSRGVYFCFNLRFDAQAIIKLLPPDLWTELWNNNNCVYKNYAIHYIQGKLLSISKIKKTTALKNELKQKEILKKGSKYYEKGKHKGEIKEINVNQGWDPDTETYHDTFHKVESVNIYDVATFYKGESLDSAAKTFLGIPKMDTIDRQKLGESMEYYDKHREEIILYCKSDAMLAQFLAIESKEQFENLGIDFVRPLSVANLAGKWVLKNYKYPKSDTFDPTYMDIARQAYRGGMFQTLQRGVFEDIWDYDIVSAYPSVMETLPHWSNGEFVEVKDPDIGEYGWYYCKFDCPYIPHQTNKKWKISDYWENKELSFETPNFQIIYPVGEREAIITKIEYEWMKKHNFPCEFIAGLEWHNNFGNEKDNLPSPFSWVPMMFEQRKKIKKIKEKYAEQYNIKIVLNSFYGKTAQYKHGITPTTNFFYSSYITAATRLKLSEIMVKHPDSILNVATDGFLSTKRITGLDIGENLGQWEEKKYQRGLLLGSGMYQVWVDTSFDKPKYYTKARGVTDNRNWDMYGAMVDNLTSDTIQFTRHSPISLGMVVFHHKKFAPSDLNRFVDFTRKVSVNSDKNHVWNVEYKNFGHLLGVQSKAKPLTLGGDKI